MTLTWENARAANGRKLVEFIEERTGERLTNDRRIWAWRNGGQATFHTADKVLCRFDLHPSEVPDDVWEEPRPRVFGSGCRPPAAVHGLCKLTDDQAAEIRRSSETSAALARAYGVSPKTIRNVRQGKTHRGKVAA